MNGDNPSGDDGVLAQMGLPLHGVTLRELTLISDEIPDLKYVGQGLLLTIYASSPDEFNRACRSLLEVRGSSHESPPTPYVH